MRCWHEITNIPIVLPPHTTLTNTKPYPLFRSYAKKKISKSTIPAKRMAKTYNSGDSLVVTHLTTNPPVHCLYMAERTGSLIFSVLWSYVKDLDVIVVINMGRHITDALVATLNATNISRF
jgi:hypothetical protein